MSRKYEVKEMKEQALKQTIKDLSEENERYRKTIANAIKLLVRYSPRTALRTSLLNLLVKSLKEDEWKLLQ